MPQLWTALFPEMPMPQPVLPDTAYSQPMTPVRSTAVDTLGFGDRIQASFADAFGLMFAAIPRILGFLIVLLIGWFVASVIARAVGTLLRTVRFNEVADRTGVTRFTRGADPSGVVATIVKWLVRIVVLLVAFDLLGLPAVSDVLRQFLLWLPNLIVAIAVLFIAGLAANALSNIVRGATSDAGFDNPDTLANVAKIAVWVFAIVIAANQAGIARPLINTLFTGAVFAVALATGLAFGLGGRETAARRLEEWDRRAGEVRRKAGDAARSAQSRT